MVISSVPRRDGETAFPEIATIFEAIRGVKRGKSERSAIDAENARVAHFKAYPELYETPAEVAEMAKRLSEKFGMERNREIKTQYQEVTCPHCQCLLPVANNIRFWSSQELVDLAKVVATSERIASENRNSPQEDVSEIVEAIHE